MWNSNAVWLALAVCACSSVVTTAGGEVWPRPVHQRNHDEYLKIEPANFHFNVKHHDCDILQKAFKRYYDVLFLKTNGIDDRPMKISNEPLKELNIYLENPCEDYPSMDMNESYKINIVNSSGTLMAPSVWGILRGLETFSQLIDYKMDSKMFVIRCTSITDRPKLIHRGFFLHNEKQFNIPFNEVLQALDIMSHMKLNVFHWTLNNREEDENEEINPVEYTREKVQNVIEYAKLRGIRVIPEFSHSSDLLPWRLGGDLGLHKNCSEPVDQTNETNTKINNVFNRIKETFKEKYFYVNYSTPKKLIKCWSINKNVQEYMQRNNINVAELESYALKNMYNISQQLGTRPIIRFEDRSDKRIYDIYPNGTLEGFTKPKDIMLKDMVRKNFPVLLTSSCWYLNTPDVSRDEWTHHYFCEPLISERYNFFTGGRTGLLKSFREDQAVKNCQFNCYAPLRQLQPSDGSTDSNKCPCGPPSWLACDTPSRWSCDVSWMWATPWYELSAVAEVFWTRSPDVFDATFRIDNHVRRMQRRWLSGNRQCGCS